MIDKRLLKIMDKEKTFLLFSLILKLLSLFANVIMIFTIADFIGELYGKNQFSYKLILVFLFILIIKVTVSKLESFISFRLSSEIKVKLRQMLFEKVYAFKIKYSSILDPAEVVQLSVDGVESLDTYFGNFIPQLIYSLLSPIILFAILFRVNLKIASILLLLVPVIPIAIMGVQKIAKRTTKKYWGSYVNLSEMFLDFLEGLTTLKIYESDERANLELNKKSEDFRVNTMKVLAVQLNNITVMDIVAYGGTAIGSILTFSNFANGNIDLRGAIIFILIASEFFLPLRLLGSFFHVAMNGMSAADRLFSILEIEDREEFEEIIKGDLINVNIKDLTFSYDREKKILNNVNMEFKAGSLTAITGESGSGKSTIASLIIGNIFPSSGEILFNDKNKINSDDRLKNCTLVDNSPYLFAGSVRYNLLMGNENASDEEMWSILEILDLKDDLMKEQGLDTLIMENGSNFSGGQAQRIAIARAILKKSKLYIFDEATSNIDSESEDKIMNLISEISKNSTIILISHHLKNAQKADYIYHLRDGKIVEEGDFNDLIEKQGDFYKLYEKQNSLMNWGL